MTPEDEDRILADGLAVAVSTCFEMGEPTSARPTALAIWEQLGRPTGLFGLAAQAIAGLPQPLTETAEQTERRRSVRERLGVVSANEQLSAALSARELLGYLEQEEQQGDL